MRPLRYGSDPLRQNGSDGFNALASNKLDCDRGHNHRLAKMAAERAVVVWGRARIRRRGMFIVIAAARIMVANRLMRMRIKPAMLMALRADDRIDRYKSD